MRTGAVLLLLMLILAGCSSPEDAGPVTASSTTTSSDGSLPGTNATAPPGLCDDPILVEDVGRFETSFEQASGILCVRLPASPEFTQSSQSYPTPESFVAVIPYGASGCDTEFYVAGQTQVFERGSSISNVVGGGGLFLFILQAAGLDLRITYDENPELPVVEVDREDLRPHTWSYEVVREETVGDPNGFRFQMDAQGPGYLRGLGQIAGQPPQLQANYALSLTDEGRTCANDNIQATLHFGGPFAFGVSAILPASGTLLHEGSYTTFQGPEVVTAVIRLTPPDDRLVELGFR